MENMAEQLLIPCSACGRTNRVPRERLATGRIPVCGACGEPLVLESRPLEVTDSTFSEEVERSPVPVLVDVWAPWCGPCRMIAPVIEELAAEMAGRLRVAKLNADENPVTAARFGIQSIPALLLLKGGREIDRMIGVQPKTEIQRRVLRAIA
jgi:thioredoxin 2